MDKEKWQALWGFEVGSPEAEAAWIAKQTFKRGKGPTIIGGSVSYEYACPITGKPVTSKRAHEENLKAHNCRVLETGEKEFNERARERIEGEFERKVEETVEREIAVMPSEKLEALSNELDRGVTTTVERG